MSAFSQSLILIITIIASYLWLQIPGLEIYSLQAFAVAILLYFIIKRVAKTKFWHILPSTVSLEFALATFAVLILVGSTGNTSSILFPISYIHLFFLSFSTKQPTAIIGTLGVVLFHYALGTSLTAGSLVNLISLPVMTLIFLFAKNQYDGVKTEEKTIDNSYTLVATELLPTLNQMYQIIIQSPGDANQQMATEYENLVKEAGRLIETLRHDK